METKNKNKKTVIMLAVIGIAIVCICVIGVFAKKAYDRHQEELRLQAIETKNSEIDGEYQMISMLQGKAHQVYTGVTLLIKKDGKKIRKTFHECSDVHVYPMSKEEIREYIATGEPMDKAGAYAIQGKCAIYIDKIEGDYNNVVGLPVSAIYRELKKLGIDWYLW